MTLRKVLSEAIEILRSAGVTDATTDSLVLLCDTIKHDKAYIYAHIDSKMDISKHEAYLYAIKRRAKREPVAYITGNCEFMSLKFIVNNRVLIPRPETETLVEEVIKLLTTMNENIRKINILDIGTGSGCIAVSLASFIKNANITAVDISADAVEIAKKNAVLNNAQDRIKFLQCDIFSNVGPDKDNGLFDAIVSNPPYIKHSRIKALQPEIMIYEPAAALDGGEDGCLFFRKIIDSVDIYLKPGGLLALETGYDQAEVLAELMRDKFKEIRILRDLSGIQRVVTGVLRNL